MTRTPILLLLLVSAATTLAGQGSKPNPAAAADFVFPGETATLPQPLTAAMASLTAPAIGTHIATLASPGFEGRGLGQAGLEATAEYIATTLAMRGVAPLGTTKSADAPRSSYFHPVPMREITQASGTLVVERRRGPAAESRTFTSGVDCLFQSRPPHALSGPVVFAGYGIRESSPSRDDYHGIDVRDRVVVVLGGVPTGVEWNTAGLLKKYAADDSGDRYEAKAELAQSLGARAVIAIEDLSFPKLLAAGTDAPAARYFTPYDAGADNDGTIPVIRVSVAAGDTLLAGAGLSSAAAGSARPQPLPDTQVTLRINGQERLVVARNVVAVVPGADSAVRDQAVIIGAHMDHLGRVEGVMHPGADDNASGTAALLEIAAAFAASPQRPRRTIVFAFWTGEEEGHLGSEYYIQRPLWPLDRTSVYLNLDMIGHPWKPEELRQLVADTGLDRGDTFLAHARAEDFLELGVPPTAPDLDPILKQVARATGVALHLDRTDGRHGGSDYRAFARKGRPFVRFFGNYFPGYHEPTDTPDQVNPGQVLKMARLAFASAWMLANR